MSAEPLQSEVVIDNAALVQRRLEQSLEGGALAIPPLPQAAVRVVQMGTRKSNDARHLSDIIDTDAVLARGVLRIAASAANRPVTPILSLQHAVAWLGFDEVANIAFTLSLQARMLDVANEKPRARRLWRHALASAVWARYLANRLDEETGLSYLCGLLHDIGKVVTLGAVNELSRCANLPLEGTDYDRLIEMFHRPIALRVVTAWRLPSPVQGVTQHWETYASLTVGRVEANIVNVAHRLADYMLFEAPPDARDLLVTDPAYRDLGLRSEDGEGLFELTADVDAELDRYLAR